MWAVVLLKDLSAVKQRLSSALSSAERAGLVLAMANDLLATLTTCADLERLVICSGDRQVEHLASHWHVEFFPERRLAVRGDVNLVANAVANAFAAQGARDVLCIPGDVPLLTTGELASFCQLHQRLPKPCVTAAPDHHGTGTNMIAWQPQSGFSVAFGPGSLARHKERAARIGAHIETHETLGGCLDIDEPGDLALLQQATSERAPVTRRYLSESGLATRLLSMGKTDVLGVCA